MHFSYYIFQGEKLKNTYFPHLVLISLADKPNQTILHQKNINMD